MMTLVNSTYKFLSALRIGFFIILTLFIVISARSYAQEESVEQTPVQTYEDPYLIENIEVDVSADNAVEARNKAFEAAQIRGYEELAKRFLTQEELTDFETPDIKKIESMVQDFEVSDEKLSATRYKASYKIRFAENTFRNAGSNGQAQDAILPQSKELLILPFMEVNNRYYLWQINPFWNAWTRAQNNKVLGKIIVPIGDTTDVSFIRDGERLTYNPAALETMRNRYRANEIVIAVASPEPLPDGTVNIAIGLYKPQAYGPELSQQLSVKSYPAEDRDQLYNRVVATIAQALHSHWQRQTAVDVSSQQASVVNPSLAGAPNMITAQFQFSSAREWVETKKTIEAVNGVQNVQIRSLSARYVTIALHFSGSVEGLRAALLQQGIQLDNTADASLYQLVLVR